MDVRWRQSLDSFSQALANLERGLALHTWNEFERQSVIKAFELCCELAWKTLQDLLSEREVEDVIGVQGPFYARLFWQVGLTMVIAGPKFTKPEIVPFMYTTRPKLRFFLMIFELPLALP